MEKAIENHELTMLYLKNQDLSSLSPTELLDKYKHVYHEIEQHNTMNYSKKWY